MSDAGHQAAAKTLETAIEFLRAALSAPSLAPDHPARQLISSLMRMREFEMMPHCRHGNPIDDSQPNPSCPRCEFAPYADQIEAAVAAGDVAKLAEWLRAELEDAA